MPEKKHRNPFEDHINSESFDVSHLDNVPTSSEMEMEIQAFFASLPEPLNHELWDTELDDRQKMICVYLTSELVEKVMRVYYGEEIQDLADDQLIYILTVPVTLAMLAEEHLHDKLKLPEPEEAGSDFAASQHPDTFAEAREFDLSTLQATLRNGVYRIRDFFIRLFRRR